MKKALLILLAMTTIACIPTRIAPRFEGHKIMQAKKFKRKLPGETSFIFKDPKNAEEFYNYLNVKFQLNNIDVGLNTRFKLDNKTFYLTYNETDIPDKNLNIVGFATDVVLQEKGFAPLFNSYENRTGHWYIILTVHDDAVKNCLLDKHPMKQKIIDYLERLRKEYLSTQNYEELLLTKKS